MFSPLTNEDMIVTESLESYLKKMNLPNTSNPEEKLFIQNEGKNVLYSKIAERVPHLARYILSDNHLADDTNAQGIYFSLSQHALDPIFCDILQKYLQQSNRPEDNAITGALLARIMDKYISEHTASVSAKPDKSSKKKKDESVEPIAEETVSNVMSVIKHIQVLVNYLLGDLANIFITRFGNLSMSEGLAIAACISMNNSDTIRELIASDLPITASVFDVISDPSEILKASLLINKEDVTGTTANQKAFVDSLKLWVYNKLNIIPTQTAYAFLVATYGSIKPDTTKYLIQIKDCGTQYSNLLTVAKQIINN